MTSLKPYLIRSIYEWIIDNEMTPHLLVDATNDRAVIPSEYVQNGEIVLNVRPAAIHGLVLGNEEIEFSARFSGNPMDIFLPIESVKAIFTKENGKGMFFDNEQDDDPTPPRNKKQPNKPKLHVVK